MRKIALILLLPTLLLLSSQALAEDGDKGPVLIVEFTRLQVREDDDMKIVRMIAGYTSEPGFQLGANLAYHSLDRPSVEGKVYCRGYPEEPRDGCTYTLEPSFTYWGFGPTLGWDVELISGWFGLEFLVTPTIPITNDSEGWAIEVGGFAYFSLESLTDDWLDLAFMAGGKFGHYDVRADRYKIKESRMMPTLGVMLQF